MKIKNGRIEGRLLEGHYDLKLLDANQLSQLDGLMKKQANGHRLTQTDISNLMKLRKDARLAAPKPAADPVAEISDSLAKLKGMFE